MGGVVIVSFPKIEASRDKVSRLNQQEYLADQEIHLKNCQTTYVQLGATATTLVAGFVAKNGTDGSPSLAFLTPVLIVLPCWLIFFEKAKSISRIVGFLLWCDTRGPDYFYPWQLALDHHRAAGRAAWGTSGNFRPVTVQLSYWQRIAKVAHFDVPVHYWTVVHITFASLAFGSVALAATGAKDFGSIGWLIWAIGSASCLVVGKTTSRSLIRLQVGRWSYESQAAGWGIVLPDLPAPAHGN